MRLLDYLTSAFINTFGITQPTETFGITQPTEQTRRRASRFIATLLCLALLMVAAIGLLIVHLLHA